jgi:hypothetical protein
LANLSLYAAITCNDWCGCSTCWLWWFWCTKK